MTNELVTRINAALAEGADEFTKQRGVNACRNLLVVLGAKPGEPLPVAAPPAAPSPLATAAQAMASAPPTALLDAVIAKLKARLPQEADEPDAQPLVLKIPFIPIPNLKGR